MLSARSEVWTGRLARRFAAFLSVLALTVALPGSAAAQGGTVTGVVTNAVSGETLAGAQVSVVGANLGTLTNNVGRFVILNVPTGTQTMRVDYIGFGSEQIEVNVTAGGSVVADFEMRSEAISLEGVVVTGTAGQARKREIGNSISQINSAQVESAPLADVGDLLQGRATGVTVLDNGGQIGAGNTIRLRGNNSVSQGNSPLIYVDGIRIENEGFRSFADEANQTPSALQDINPEDIERVEIIKGAAATTLYGTEAAGGVIQIFTKAGAAGRPAWSLSVEQGINNAGHIGPDSDPTGLWMNDCTEFPGCPRDGDWLETGHIQKYNLSVRGGTETTNYFLSGSWGDERGVLATSLTETDNTAGPIADGLQGSQNWTLRGNFGFNPRDDLTIRFNNAFTHKNIDWAPDGNNAEGVLLNVMRGPADYTPDHDDSVIFEMRLNSLVDHYTTGVNINYTPGSITHRLNAGLDWSQHDYAEERPWQYFYVPGGDREADQAINRKLTLDYAGGWNTSFGETLSSSLSWGGQLYDDYAYVLNGFGEEFAGPGDKVLDSGARTQAFEDRISVTNGGFFLQEQIGINDQLFLTAGVRVDGHSAFGDDFGFAPYPKVSASYIISDNDWFPVVFDALKLRAAFGESGKAPGVFDALRTWDAVSGDEGQPAVTPSNLGNADLGPERTREFELGFEGAMLDGRVSFEYTYYDQVTSDALIDVQQVPSQGFINAQLRNVGQISNSGHEAFVNFNAVRGENFNWDLGARFATNRSQVDDLGGLESISLAWRNFVRAPSFADDKGFACDEGTPGCELTKWALPVFCHDDVVNPAEVGVNPIREERCYGPVYPTKTLGLNTSLTFAKRFTLDVLGEGQYGAWLSSGVAYQNVRRGTWPLCTEIQTRVDADDPTLTAEERFRCDPSQTRYGAWAQPTDFFKVRSASLSIRLPENILPSSIRAATLRLQGRNLFTFTDFDGLDPEAFEDGSGRNVLFRQEYYNLPPSRTFLVSMKVDF